MVGRVEAPRGCWCLVRGEVDGWRQVETAGRRRGRRSRRGELRRRVGGSGVVLFEIGQAARL